MAEHSDLHHLLAPDEVIHVEATAPGRPARRDGPSGDRGWRDEDRDGAPHRGASPNSVDIERTRPATLVIVPELASNQPQVLAIPHEQIRAVSEVLIVIAERMSA